MHEYDDSMYTFIVHTLVYQEKGAFPCRVKGCKYHYYKSMRGANDHMMRKHQLDYTDKRLYTSESDAHKTIDNTNSDSSNAKILASIKALYQKVIDRVERPVERGEAACDGEDSGSESDWNPGRDGNPGQDTDCEEETASDLTKEPRRSKRAVAATTSNFCEAEV